MLLYSRKAHVVGARQRRNGMLVSKYASQNVPARPVREGVKQGVGTIFWRLKHAHILQPNGCTIQSSLVSVYRTGITPLNQLS